jgi:hypothetical protein
MGGTGRQYDGHGEDAGTEVLSAPEYAEALRYDMSGVSPGTPAASSGENSCGSPAKGLEQHVCMGLNACGGFDIDRGARMAGTGNCATVRHVCHGEGNCRGQGGCGYAGSDEQQWRPGEQACRYNGSCAVPINVSRVFSNGPMEGRSVWKQARRLMEDRMYRAGLAFAPSPGEGIPDGMIPHYDIDDEKIPPPQESAAKRTGDGAAQSKK